jgi:hypothetical protein
LRIPGIIYDNQKEPGHFEQFNFVVSGSTLGYCSKKGFVYAANGIANTDKKS